MAAIAFPYLAKSYTLSTSRTYSYAYSPPTSPTLPTILFLHGFPPSCYDWRYQIQFFFEEGYGVLAPDLLGYGGTTKPTSLDAYKTKRMAAEMMRVLDHEGIETVHAVAHDTGCILLSRPANYFPSRLLSCTFLDVPYARPGEHFDLDKVNALTKQFLGFERFGYPELFIRDDACVILDQHPDSFSTLFYPQDPKLWVEHVGPTGSLEKLLRDDRKAPRPDCISEIERQMHQTILQNSHSSALKWYQALVRNINETDEIEAKLDPMLSMPVFMVCPRPSELELPGVEEQMRQVALDFTFKRVSTAGHWMQLEARDEVNSILKGFFERQIPST